MHVAVSHLRLGTPLAVSFQLQGCSLPLKTESHNCWGISGAKSQQHPTAAGTQNPTVAIIGSPECAFWCWDLAGPWQPQGMAAIFQPLRCMMPLGQRESHSSLPAPGCISCSGVWEPQLRGLPAVRACNKPGKLVCESCIISHCTFTCTRRRVHRILRQAISWAYRVYEFKVSKGW